MGVTSIRTPFAPPLDAVTLAREPAFRIGGGCVVRPSLNQIALGDQAQRLEPRVMQVLVVLAHRNGTVVSRDDLMQACWGGVVVGDDALNRCIVRLRAALRDLGVTGVAIETVPRVGYIMNLDSPLELDGTPLPSGAAPEAEAAPFAPDPTAAPRRSPLLWIAAGVAALALAAVAFLIGDREPAGWTVARMKPVTTYPGREIYPTLSPDGGQMVFSGRLMDAGNVDLYQRSVLDGSPIRLTTDPGNDIAAAWAPNGSEVAYVTYRAGEPCRIMLLAVPSGDPRMVHRCKAAEITTLSWMPDGRSLVYTDGPDPAAAMSLHRVNLDDGGVEALTASPPRAWGDGKPAVSPDGRTVAFIRSYAWGVSDIVLLDLETRRETRLTEEGQRVSGLAWAWDSQGLFFSSSRTGDLGLWWISTGGGEPRRLSLGLKDVAGLTAARSVDRLAFESMSFRANLYEVDLTGEPGRMTALAPSTAIDGDVDVSPTDGTVAFVSTRTGAPELWLLEPGGEPRRLTQMGGSMLQAPRWSPDGRGIVFATGTKGNFDLYRIGREGGAPVRLTDDPSEDMQAFWSPDGASIYFTTRRSGAWRIWRMDAADPSKQESVTGDLVSSARLSPDGRTLYYVKTHTQGIWRRALAADAAEELLVPDHSAVDWPNFLPTADSVYYVTRPGTGRTVLKVFDLATGQSRQLAEMTDFNAASGIALRPDGKALVISRLIQNEIDLQMMDLARQK